MKKKIIALILVVFSFTLALLFNSCGYSKNSNNQSNLDYYSINYNDDYYFVKGNNVIVKDNDENEKTLFKENESLLLIGIENNTLYYETSNNKTNAFNIKKYELENKKKTVLIDSSKYKKFKNEYLHNVELKNNKLFLQMSYAFFVFDIKNAKLDKYADDVREFQVKDNNLYFIDGSFNFYKLNLKDKNKKLVLKADDETKYSNFLVINDNIYLYSSNSKKLYLKNKDKLTCVDTENIDSSSLINYNNELYFIAENTLFKLDKSNNKQKITECENYSTGLEIINDKIYYINLNDKLVYQNLD